MKTPTACAEDLNAKLLARGCCPIWLPHERRVRFLGNNVLPVSLYDDVKDNATAFVRYLTGVGRR